VPPTSNQDDVVARLEEPTTDDTADCPGPDDRKPHLGLR
jgi:hypothetical protein